MFMIQAVIILTWIPDRLYSNFCWNTYCIHWGTLWFSSVSSKIREQNIKFAMYDPLHSLSN